MANRINILHISDPHTDLEYSVGAKAKCDFPLCCREESKGAETPFRAGKWGSLAECDLPEQTIDQFINDVKKKFGDTEIAFATWTGDNTSHDIWHQSSERNVENSKRLTDKFKRSFGFKFFPSNGNHESFPVDNYDFFSDREKPFNSALAGMWQDWIGVNAANKYKDHAFYATELKEFNLKVISLNTQTCDDMNFFLLRDPSDPANMLEWLRNELTQSERNNQFVYIIGHIPVNSCLDDWAAVYTALVERFNFIIRGQFFGHTHGDSLTVFRDSTTNKVYNTLFKAPSLTTYSKRNPSYRIYQIDLDTMLVTNYSQYRLNLTKWNNSTESNIEWDLAYSFSTEYDVNNATYEGIAAFSEKLRTDNATIDKYGFHQSSGYEGDNNKKKTNKHVSDSENSYWYCDTFPTGDLTAKCLNNTDGPSFTDRLLGWLRGGWKRRKN